MPTKRPTFSIPTAKAEKDRIMPIIRAQLPDHVKIVDVDDLCTEGMRAYRTDIDKVVDKFKK